MEITPWNPEMNNYRQEATDKKVTYVHLHVDTLIHNKEVSSFNRDPQYLGIRVI